MNENIQRLQQQIQAEESKIRNCDHLFGDPFYNPETIKEPYGFKTVAMGSDVWTEPEGYRDVEKDRWTRVCSKCGYEQHTTEKEPIINGYQPKFK